MIRSIARIPVRLRHWVLASLARNVQNVVTALVQIWANKGRSVLTTLGIIIAVTSIITVVAIVQGFGEYMTEMVRGYGTQYMVVHPYWPRGWHQHGLRRVTLEMEDIEAVRAGCSHVGRISPFIFTGDAKVSYGHDTADEIPIRGVSEDYQVIRNFHADAGRFFGPVDIENGAYVAVLGRTLLRLLGCDQTIIGEYVHIDDARFLVIGLLETKGSFHGDDQDKTIMIPYTTALKLYPELRTRTSFLAEAIDEEHVDSAYAQMTRVLRRRHGLQEGQPDDFRIQRQDQALREFEQVRNIASSILAGIVSISLLVGGIGIMNMMLVSVTERTHEIGLRKSVGGRRRDIMLQFLTEAIVLCTLGGMVGIALGYGIAHVASLHPQMVQVTVPWWAVAIALLCSTGTGIVFGMIPAFKAAILSPIDALRHE